MSGLDKRTKGKQDELVYVPKKLVQSARNLMPSKEKQNSNDEKKKDLSSISNVVHLSVTGLNHNDLNTFWETLETFKNLTSLQVVMTAGSSITLQHCGKNLKKKLERLRMTADQFCIGSTSAEPQSVLENLGIFGSLTDLTLNSPKLIKDINSITGLKKLSCLRLYGDSQGKTCRIELKGFDGLRKLVIGNMELVKEVQIGDAVIRKIATLKLYNLPLLRKVVYSEKQHPNKHRPLITWENDKLKVSIETVDISNSLVIYKYDNNKECQKYIVQK